MKRSLVYGSLAVALVASVGMAQSVTIDNGVVGDGHLKIDVDGYGGYTNWGWAANLDYYDPAGALAESNPMFAGSFMFYTPIEKVCFAEPFFDLDNTYNLRAGTFDLPTPSNPVVNVAGDEASSSWSSTNFAGDISLDFTLVQTVAAGAGSVATLTQVLTVTNRSAAAVTGTLQRHLDLDLLWDASAEDVAGSVDCAGTIIPYQREPDGNRNSESLISLTSPDAYTYVSSKSGFDGQGGSNGTGAGTSMAFGTDFQIWDNFGYPTGWSNYTAGVGHAPTVGELLGAQPAGSISPFDCFINIEWAVNLAPGASQTITAVTQYGTDCTAGGGCPPCACEFDTSTGANICDIFDFLGFQNGFVAGDPCAIDLNTTTGPGVGDIFDFLDFQNSFVGGPCP
jgi:hypothetical protein